MNPNQGDEARPLVVAIEDGPLAEVGQSSSKSHARDTHILSLSFFFIFCAYSAAQNLESTINTVLLRMLPNYHHHVRTYENTLKTKFFGLHRVIPSSGQKTTSETNKANREGQEYVHTTGSISFSRIRKKLELKLQRDVIVALAFIASSGSSSFDVLLYSATPQRLNFLELIIRILAFGMDTEEAKSQTFCKERFSVFRESLILLNRLSSNPSYSNATLEVLTRKATATLTVNVSNRMSRKSQSHWKRHATNKMQLEEELVDLARMFKARVFTFLGQNQ